MTVGPQLLDKVRAAFEPHGLFLRGMVNFTPGEPGPELADGQAASSIVLVGNIGTSIWSAFERWRQEARHTAHPLDDWSKAVIRPVADEAGASAFFPSDPPWQPFQQWAMRAEGLKPSPLGILIHPEYGLWHGYRGALAFDRPLPQTGVAPALHHCDSCLEKPCLSACPVHAVDTTRFDVKACRSHLATDEGANGCMTGGCLARNTCPVGVEHRYCDAQLGFHMAALNLGF